MSNYKIQEIEIPEEMTKEQVNPMDEKEIIFYYDAITDDGRTVSVEGVKERVNKQSCLNKIAELDEQKKRLQTERDFWQDILDNHF